MNPPSLPFGRSYWTRGRYSLIRSLAGRARLRTHMRVNLKIPR